MTTDEWLRSHGAPHQDQARELAETVRAAAELQEAVKWGRLTFTAAADWHHWVCAIAVAKNGVSLVFHKGVLLADPAGLLVGDGRDVRRVPYPSASAQPDAVTALVREAVAHQRDMLPDG
ncbi:MAG: hypothetical protein GEV07_04345 [Streptosporangiales bacterium]|nr:hypothetical protein [Streptosporangiales bacterium]